MLIKHHLLVFGLLIGICLLITRTLISSQLPRTNDGELHGARVANYYLALKQGQLPPRWAPNLNYGFGYPIFLYNYHLPYVFAVVFYAGGFSIEQSINSVVILSVLVTGVGWYLLSNLYTANKFWSLTMTGLVLTAPYFLLNIFVRGAIGEVVFFAFIPWVIYFFEKTLQSKQRVFQLVFIVCVTLLFLSHHILSLFFLPFLLVYFLQKSLSTEGKTLRLLCFSFVIAACMVGFFYIPLIFEKNLIRLASDDSVANFQQAFVSLDRIIWSAWNYGGMNGDTRERFTVMIGPLLFMTLASSVISIRNKHLLKTQERILLVVSLVCVFLMTKYSFMIWNVIEVMKYIQFPWRLLQLIIVSLTLYNCIQIPNFVKDYPRAAMIVGISAWIWIIYVGIWWAKPSSFISNTDHDWREYGKTGDASEEFMPKDFNQHKNYKFTDQIIFRKSGDVFSLYEPTFRQGKVNIISWTGSKKIYQIESEQPIEVIEKTLYFPGWKVKANSQLVRIEKSDQFPGRVVYNLSPGKYRIESYWSEDTWPRKIGNTMTILGVFLFSYQFFMTLKEKS